MDIMESKSADSHIQMSLEMLHEVTKLSSLAAEIFIY